LIKLSAINADYKKLALMQDLNKKKLPVLNKKYHQIFLTEKKVAARVNIKFER